MLMARPFRELEPYGARVEAIDRRGSAVDDADSAYRAMIVSLAASIFRASILTRSTHGRENIITVGLSGNGSQPRVERV